MWTSHNTFLETLSTIWNSFPPGGGMRYFYNKLQKTKMGLKQWNKSTFGDIFEEVKRAEIAAQIAEDEFLHNPGPDSRTQWSKSQAQLLLKLKQEKEFWKQRSKIKWLMEGEANTKFYHNFVRQRRWHQSIQLIEDDLGLTHSDQESIAKVATDHIQNLYSNVPGTSTNMDTMLDLLQPIITSEDNAYLTTIPTKQEIKDTMWALNPDSSAGPDGFNGHFYRSSWSIIENDLTAVQEFFLGLPMPKGLSWTLDVHFVVCALKINRY
ncbi:unnamed protein product [Cuscuta epithymum]|uniref:Reverse transcriptase domain-containing protein n=1 Tax=Cuscuta epithymum TaxID=186058 RepID=A0AAV0D9S3_9ASTE|nr:unnamed protein product [Cuscuta epithymum]